MIREILQLRSIVEMLIFAVVFYIVLSFLRGTRGESVIKGFVVVIVLVFIGAMYAAEQMNLRHFKDMLQWILNGSFLALIVIFAPELRNMLTRMAESPILSPLFHGPPVKVVDEIVNAAVRLSKNRIGMLVAIQRQVPLGDYVEKGVRMNAEVSRELLETIFYPGSALHDGAVVVQDNRVAAAGCLFPLTEDPAISKSMGTRHRAAIGISETTDAITLIVSEETGRISIAVAGKLTTDLNKETLEQALRELYTRADRPGFHLPRFRREGDDETTMIDGNGQNTPPTMSRPEPETTKKQDKDKKKPKGKP